MLIWPNLAEPAILIFLAAPPLGVFTFILRQWQNLQLYYFWLSGRAAKIWAINLPS
jgi:hypothetical protein